MKAPPFINRWLITGTLTTESELHIGDGEAGAIHDRSRQADKANDEHDASTVCVDHRRRAYVPGSAIKGSLRDLVMIFDPKTGESHIHPHWEALFGSDSPDADNAVGGRLEFWDAFHSGGQGTDAEAFNPTAKSKGELITDRNRPWWDKNRKTCVAVSVSLDRRTRTAKENLLYHLEYVPAGESFAFEISGENLEEHDVARLLVLLDQFTDGNVNLGAQGSNDWGGVKCDVKEIRCLDVAGLAAWKQNPQPGLAACKPVALDCSDRIKALKEEINLPVAACALTIALRLSFESPWLIRDPRQRERSETASELVKQKKLAESDKPTDAIPIRDELGNAFVPAKSLRGALRSRAEMILRTLEEGLPVENKCAPHPADLPAISTKGSHPDTAVEEALAEVRKTDLAARLFGLSGWLAPLHIPRLTQKKAPPDHPQEFIAIDRFTGGAANTAKFDACLAGMTVLEGTLTLDLDRLKKVDENRASLGLFALVLRDLAEGDIPIGSGSAKGQGFCEADATITENGQTHSILTEWFQNSALLKMALPALRALNSESMTATETANT